MITPRKNEIDTVVAILESDSYDTPEAMSKALIKAVVAELEKRDTWVAGVGYPNEGPWMPVGPFWGKADAHKFSERAHTKGQVSQYGILVGPSSLYEDVPDQAPDCTCGHHRSIHTTSWGCCVMLNGREKSKGGEKCPCSGFTAREVAA